MLVVVWAPVLPSVRRRCIMGSSFPGHKQTACVWEEGRRKWANNCRSRGCEGRLSEVPAVPRAVLHALELAKEDLQRWCGDLSDAELNARPNGDARRWRSICGTSHEASIGFSRMPRVASSMASRLRALKIGIGSRARRAASYSPRLNRLSIRSAARIRAIEANRLNEPRKVGRKELPTTVGGCSFTSPITRSGTWGKPLRRQRSSRPARRLTELSAAH